MRILFGVSDNSNSERLYRGLHASGIIAFMTWDFKEVIASSGDTAHEAIVLDPGPAGWQMGLGVTKLLRRDIWEKPIVLLVDKNDSFNRKLAWQIRCDAICDRYIDPSELAELIRARVERRPPKNDDCYQLTPYTPFQHQVELDRKTYTVRRGRVSIELSPQCYRLLAYLYEHMNEQVTPAMLTNDVLLKHFNGNMDELNNVMAQLERSLRDLGVNLLHRVESVSLKQSDFEMVGLEVIENELTKNVLREMLNADDSSHPETVPDELNRQIESLMQAETKENEGPAKVGISGLPDLWEEKNDDMRQGFESFRKINSEAPKTRAPLFPQHIDIDTEAQRAASRLLPVDDALPN